MAWLAGAAATRTKRAGKAGGRERRPGPANAIRVPSPTRRRRRSCSVPLIKAFNAEERREVDGRTVFVEGLNVSSGDAESRIAKGTLQAGRVVARLARCGGGCSTSRPTSRYAPDESPSIVRTPLVIAMWEPMAQRARLPAEEARLRRRPRARELRQGLGRVRAPRVRRVQARPHQPRLLDLRALGRRRRVLRGDRQEGGPDREGHRRRAPRASACATSSARSSTTATRRCSSPTRCARRARATRARSAMEEVTLLDFNRDARRPRASSSRSIPRRARSTPTSRSSCSRRRGCRPSRPRARRRSRSSWPTEITPEVAAKSGFRPADLETAPVAPITAANGADPKQPERVLGLPEPRVLAAIKTAWREDRKPANILLVLDTSGSMDDGGAPRSGPRRGCDGSSRASSRRTRVGLTIFSDQIQPLVAARRRSSKNRHELQTTRREPDRRRRHRVLRRDREAFDAVRDSLRRPTASTPSCCSPTARTPTRTLSVDEVVQRPRGPGRLAPTGCACSRSPTRRARPARASSLEQIAAASGGLDYEGKTEDIESVYRSICSFF